MNQILTVWSGLDIRRRIVVIGATLAMFAAILGLARMAAQPSWALLYSGLEPAASGDVIAALESNNAAYEVRGGAIFVEAAKRDSLRMTLASDGLPANSVQGYELLDGLTGFGTTSQMFDAAYWRAKEGELARTIMSAPGIQAARVHIASPAGQGLRARANPTASVAITSSEGAISAAHAKALKYLVASAVSGLSPEDVSVIDARGGLIATGDETENAGAGGSSRAEELRQNVERLLEARVGYGNAVVEVNVETVTERATLRERVIDPQSRVAISSETEETSNNSTDNRESAVSVASNLPSGDNANGSQSSANGSETRERVAYDISATTREVIQAPGAIKRLSIAVLVDGVRSVDESGLESWAPRSEDELQALHELVASAVGLDEARGDSLTLKSLEFEPLAELGTSGEADALSGLGLDLLSLIQLGVLATVALGLGLFVLRPALNLRAANAIAAGPEMPGLPVPGAAIASTSGANAGDLPALADQGSKSGDLPDLPALSGEIDSVGDFPQMATITDIDFGDGNEGNTEVDPVERLRALIEARQEETVEILRGWMDTEKETA